MPGIIQVSVLGFIDLPFSSSSPSSISVNVSMGKRQYQTWDKGDFSFPLTTLRENLILTVQDDEGNEIAHADVQAKSIVEKGFWDDLFPLEGGGYVHMQLQFVLSPDERNRIRMMRESALRKKHGEQLNMKLISSENANAVESNVASSFYLNPELSDSQSCLLQIGEIGIKEAAERSSPASTNFNFGDIEKRKSENGEGTQFNHNQLNPNDADRLKETSSTVPALQEVDTQLPEPSEKQLDQKTATESVQEELPLQAIDTQLPKLSRKQLDRKADTELVQAELQEVDTQLPKLYPKPLDKKTGSESIQDELPFQAILQEVDTQLPELSQKQLDQKNDTKSVQAELPLQTILREVDTQLPKPSEKQLDQKTDKKSVQVEIPLRAILQEVDTQLPEPNQKILDKRTDSESVDTRPPETSEKQLDQKIDTQPIQDEFPSRAIYSEEGSNLSKDSESTEAAMVAKDSFPSNLKEERANNGKKLTPAEKTRSNVRKMISAFEGSLAQDTRPRIKPPLLKTHSSMVGKQTSLEEDTAKPSQSEKALNPFLVGELKQVRPCLQKGKVEKSEIKEENKGLTVKFEEENVKKEKADQDSIIITRLEMTTDTERVIDDQPGKDHRSDLVTEKQETSGNLVLMGCIRKIPSDNTREINNQETTITDMQSAAYPKCQEEQCSSRSSGAWIFPDDARPSCITTGGKKAMDLMKVNGNPLSIHQGDIRVSIDEPKDGRGIEVNGGKKTNEKIRESKSECSKGAGTSEGPLGQAIKIAVMVGFGVLVLLTRQNRKR